MLNLRIHGEQVIIETIDSRERWFTNYFAERNPSQGPGWYVFGRCDGVSAKVIKSCARPDLPARSYKNYNGLRHRGWLRKRDAQRAADAMNEMTGLALAEWLGKREDAGPARRAALRQHLERFDFIRRNDFSKHLRSEAFAAALAEALDGGFISAMRAARELNQTFEDINQLLADQKIATRILL